MQTTKFMQIDLSTCSEMPKRKCLARPESYAIAHISYRKKNWLKKAEKQNDKTLFWGIACLAHLPQMGKVIKQHLVKQHLRIRQHQRKPCDHEKLRKRKDELDKNLGCKHRSIMIHCFCLWLLMLHLTCIFDFHYENTLSVDYFMARSNGLNLVPEGQREFERTAKSWLGWLNPG